MTESLLELVKVFGPIGAPFMLLVLLVGWVYRRDFLREREDRDAARKELTGALIGSAKATEQHASAASDLARAIERLGQQMGEAERERARQGQEMMLTITRTLKGSPQ